MSTLEKAIAIAAAAHAGQVDKAGQAYILHPLRVMLAMNTGAERIVAVLHDVVEDCDVSFDDLAQAGFEAEIVEALRALSKLPGETKLQAAARVVQNPLATRVKLADNLDNMDLSRIKNPQAADFARLEEYKKVRTFLLENGKF